MKPVTVEKQNEWLAEDIVSRTEALVASGDITPEQALDLQIERFATAGIDNPQWMNVLSAGVTGANAWSISGNDTAPPALVEGAKLYMELYAKAPHLLGKHLKDAEAKRFYENYRVAIQRGGMEPQQAYSHAVTVSKLPPIDNPLTSVPRAELEAAVNRVGDGSGNWFGGPANNSAAVAQELMNIASDYTLSGTLTGAAAIEEATKSFLISHRNINGQWVDTSDQHIPANFDELARIAIANYAKDFDEDPNELTIRPSTNGSGAWEIIHKGGWPMPVDNAARRNITLESMGQALATHTEAAAAALVASQAETQATEEKARFDQLTTLVQEDQQFLDSPDARVFHAGKDGPSALAETQAVVKARLAANQAELDALQRSADLRAVETQAPTQSVNLDLLK